MQKHPIQNSRRVHILIEIINLLCFVSLLQIWFREIPNYVVEISFVIGCIATVIMLRYDKNMQSIAKLLAAFYILNLIGGVSYVLSGG